MRNPEAVAKDLTPAERVALHSAMRHNPGGPFFVPHYTHHNVRRRLVEKGLLKKRLGNPLLALGRTVRAVVVTEAIEGLNKGD